MSKIALEVKGLVKQYKDLTAVNDLDLKVEAGKIYGLLGPNGAGKSTTIDCVLGMKPYLKGEITVLGLSPTKDRKKLYQRVGVQFQSSFYPERIKVYEICEMISALYKSPDDWRGLLKQFNLEAKSRHYVASLSGGERQKLSVLLALIQKPEMVFLDELTTGLDPKARREVWTLLKKLNQNGLTIFLTSHYMDEVMALCDEVNIINHGVSVASGTPQDIIALSGMQNLEEAYLYFIDEKEMIHGEVAFDIL
ncbi:ABC transporter ATP-binding protein [Fusibacter sp. 3D3]|uniref:ABC transporter ATP-binding protein n=1 Tax=Fusibacter sp. 3D3 TaxID=1048380 RepID=UPI000852B728|nr:ABC transporter ATP-binding protein [Fusibacter sp. 3D3]GAU78371.1 ABC transporter, ATP-binding subunit [Fusibacter sp. 3D3]